MANTDPNSAIGQSQTANTAYASFFSAVNQYLTGQSSTCPEFSDALSSLDFSELHRVAVSGQQGSANYPGAAAVENVHHMAAILREYGIRTKTKNTYYQDAQTDSQNEFNFYSSMTNFYAQMLAGNFTEGATS